MNRESFRVATAPLPQPQIRLPLPLLHDSCPQTLGELACERVKTKRHAILSQQRTLQGHGWFVDPTPFDDAEFELTLSVTPLSAIEDGPAAGQIDLLSVLMHELGHVLGYGHAPEVGDPTGAMRAELAPGQRTGAL